MLIFISWFHGLLFALKWVLPPRGCLKIWRTQNPAETLPHWLGFLVQIISDNHELPVIREGDSPLIRFTIVVVLNDICFFLNIHHVSRHHIQRVPVLDHLQSSAPSAAGISWEEKVKWFWLVRCCHVIRRQLCDWSRVSNETLSCLMVRYKLENFSQWLGTGDLTLTHYSCHFARPHLNQQQPQKQGIRLNDYPQTII